MEQWILLVQANFASRNRFPVILMVTNTTMEILLQGLVYPLPLIIRQWLLQGGNEELCLQNWAENWSPQFITMLYHNHA